MDEQRVVALQDAQDAFEAHKRLTRKGLAELLGCPPWKARDMIEELVLMGVVRETPCFEQTGKRGRPAPIFAVVPQGQPAAAAIELRSGLHLNEVAPVPVPVQRIGERKARPLPAVTDDDLKPKGKPKRRRAKAVRSTGGKVKRRKGKLGTDAVLARAVELGYEVSHTRNGHFRFDRPDLPRPLFGSSNPSDYRGVKNTIASLERGRAA